MKKVFYLDLFERLVWTVIQAAAGAAIDLLATGEITFRAVAIAGVIALLKGLVATRIGDKNSAATLPSPPDFAIPASTAGAPEDVAPDAYEEPLI